MSVVLRTKGWLVWLLLTLSMWLLAGCSKYDKVLKSGDPALIYKTGLALYEKGKYSRALRCFETSLPYYRVTARADSLGFYMSHCYFKAHDYVLAGYSFQQVVQNYPRSIFAEECSYMAAYSLYKASPRPALDQEYTHQSIAGFDAYLAQYPEGKYKGESKVCMQELYAKLMEKSFQSAYMYYHQRNYRAAVVALRGSLEEWPLTPRREEIMYLIGKSSYYYAVRSVHTKQRERYQLAVDDYLSFLGEYPESKHLKELSNYYTRSMEFLGEKPNEEFVR